MSYKLRKASRRKHLRSSDATERVYDFLRDWTSTRGTPPTLREMASRLGYSSPNSIRYHLKRLEEMGWVCRAPRQARGTIPEDSAKKTRERTDTIPILGRVAAGVPLMAVENREGSLPLNASWLGLGSYFALRVRGDSMMEAGIRDGDLALIRQQETADDGDIVLALLEGEATIKRFRSKRSRIWLRAENPDFQPIRIETSSEFSILGIVVGLFRSLTVGS